MVFVIVFFAVLVSATFGFGEALIAMPLLGIFWKPELAGALVALVSLCTSAVIVFKNRAQISFGQVLPFLVSAALGIPLGVYLASAIEAQLVKNVLGIIIICFSLYSLFKPNLSALSHDKYAPIAGFLAGIFGGAYNISGPPMVLYGSLRRWSGDVFRMTLQAFFLPVSALVVGVRAYKGEYTAEVLSTVGLLLPLMGLAIGLGTWLNTKISEPARFHKYVHLLLLILGGMLLEF